VKNIFSKKLFFFLFILVVIKNELFTKYGCEALPTAKNCTADEISTSSTTAIDAFRTWWRDTQSSVSVWWNAVKKKTSETKMNKFDNITDEGIAYNFFNNKRANFSDGGYVPTNPKMNPTQKMNDSLRVWLEPASLVIPLEFVKPDGQKIQLAETVRKIIQLKHLKYTQPEIKDKTKLIRAVIQPGELVISRKYAQKFIKMLKSMGIHLPNT
jgi:hypothetical protein